MTTTFEPHQPDVLVVRLDDTEDERAIIRSVEDLGASTLPVVLDISAEHALGALTTEGMPPPGPDPWNSEGQR